MNATKKAWDSYRDAVEPLVRPFAQKVAGHQIQRLMGYWFLWHYFGGKKALLDMGMLTEPSEKRQRRQFRQTFGVEVDDFFPELAEKVAEMHQHEDPNRPTLR